MKFWTRTWSLVGGCTEVSEGCRGCWLRKEYHMRRNHPTPKVKALYEGFTDDQGNWTGEVRFRSDRLELPLHWRKPQVVAIWSDLYHPAVSDEQIITTMGIMADCPQHTFLIVTKRSERDKKEFGFWHNIYHLITCENQARLEERWPYIQKIEGKKVLLLEPLLGSIDLEKNMSKYILIKPAAFVDGVITGGETGPGARPAHPDWFRSLRDQCHIAGVPFFLKYIDKKHGSLLDEQEHNDLAWR